MNLSNAFSYKVMAEMARYLATYSQASQTLAIHDSNATSIKSTGTKPAFFDGDYVNSLAADPELDCTGETNESVTAWANNTAYTFNAGAPTIRSANVAEGTNVRFRLTASHTSNEVHDKPGAGAKWESYWVREPHDAPTANTAIVGFGNSRNFLVLAQRDGTLSTHKAGNEANSAKIPELKIPQFDPYTYCPVGLLHVNYHHTSGNWQFGQDDFNATNCTTTFVSFTAPVFPHVDNIDKN